MLFNSLHYLIFFPVVTLGFFALPHRLRWMWLLAASCYFYMVFIPAYILILFLTITIDYVAGIQIARASGRRRTLFLVASIAANVGVLATFKYAAFLAQNVVWGLGLTGYRFDAPALDIILPIGLSFHTFQAMSYTIEVYRGAQPPERHVGVYALYVMFFPQLVAGPIERPQNLLHQFWQEHHFKYDLARNGAQLILWGLFKKAVVADRLAQVVDPIYSAPAAYQGFPLVLATVFFAFQIYCDFSGYSDIARGSAEILGFRLMPNFRRPYFSHSISEFWRRWHVSLSTWFRDYVYVPLGGSRANRSRWYANLFLTFLISGLWHGANWTFVVWGALNGGYLIASLATAEIRARLRRGFGLERLPAVSTAIQIGTTFGLTCLAWVFFRASSMSDAIYIVTHMGFPHSTWEGEWASVTAGVTSPSLVNLAVALILMVLAVESYEEYWGSVKQLIEQQTWWVRWTLYYTACLAIVILGVMSQAQAFIYFQF